MIPSEKVPNTHQLKGTKLKPKPVEWAQYQCAVQKEAQRSPQLRNIGYLIRQWYEIFVRPLTYSKPWKVCEPVEEHHGQA
jgi:hypothetical protein